MRICQNKDLKVCFITGETQTTVCENSSIRYTPPDESSAKHYYTLVHDTCRLLVYTI